MDDERMKEPGVFMNREHSHLCARNVADKIARDLFTPAGGTQPAKKRDRADHLRLYRNGIYLGGWAEKPMAEYIYKHLVGES